MSEIEEVDYDRLSAERLVAETNAEIDKLRRQLVAATAERDTAINERDAANAMLRNAHDTTLERAARRCEKFADDTGSTSYAMAANFIAGILREMKICAR